MKHKGALVDALCRELVLRKDELQVQVQNIYFGGGTPSLLKPQELEQIFETIHKHYNIHESPEITLEANPDDISEELLRTLKQKGINRLSLGVQSFFEEDLKLMNRAHNVQQAHESIELVKGYFDNFSIDLIYGMPDMDLSRWDANLQKALDFEVPHLSCYALTVEPNTALNTFIEKAVIPSIDEDMAATHFDFLYDKMLEKGYEHYEFSNFGKPGYFSQNNLNYWLGKPYLGIGPSGNGYDGKNKRTWNIKNNIKYIKAIANNELPQNVEILSKTDRYNEFIMTRLRTKWGIDFDELNDKFGRSLHDYLILQIQNHLDENNLEIINNHLVVTKKGKFLSDGIAADLFKINYS
jgi:oxygen-independent coproporphyrinogen-3 oxidase